MRPASSRTTRSTMPATPPTRIARPHSSATSRATASRVVSPRFTSPPGRLHLPAEGAWPRRTSSTRLSWRTTAPTPTRGCSGYSRLTRVGRRGKDGAEARRVDPEQNGPVLEERTPVAPLGAADKLLPVEFDLAAPRPREAEGRRRALVAGDPDHLDGRPQRAEPGGERPPDPLVAVQEVARAAADVVGRSDHAVGELTLGAVVVDRAPARRPPHKPDAEPPAGRAVDVSAARPAVAERHRRRGPREEADRRGRRARPASEPHRLVDRHVRGAVGGLGHEQAPRPAARAVRHAPSIAWRPASRCCTVPASLQPPSRRSRPHGALGLRLLAITHSQLT